jgi:hypothetical protein
MAISTYYFDGSDAEALDPNSVWTDETNTDDGSTVTYAVIGTSGTTASNYVMLEGTNAPATGGPITQVRARIFGAVSSLDTPPWIVGTVYTNGLGESLETVSNRIAGVADWDIYYTLATPTGGWTWPILQALEIKLYRFSGIIPRNCTLHKIEIEVTYVNQVTSSPLPIFYRS